jgi:hypothetical protein
MVMGHGGTYVLTLEQTTLDGAPALNRAVPRLGQVWRWQGKSVRLDGPQSTLVLNNALGYEAWREKVAQAVQRRFEVPGTPDEAGEKPVLAEGFIVSDALNDFTLVPVEVDGGARHLLWCPDGLPTEGRDYMVSDVAPDNAKPRSDARDSGDMICFTNGARIHTLGGPVPIESLSPGDKVLTRDNGPQEIVWIGKRHVTGARLYAMPELRPVRIRAQAMEMGVPDDDLLVSPDHRMLYAGRNARALFNSDEVLVAARDMVNDHSVITDHSVRSLCYIHLMFAEHQIIWANNLPTESFEPARTSLDAIEPQERAALLELFPHLGEDLHSYGPPARRHLSRSDAAILLHDLR